MRRGQGMLRWGAAFLAPLLVTIAGLGTVRVLEWWPMAQRGQRYLGVFRDLEDAAWDRQRLGELCGEIAAAQRDTRVLQRELVPFTPLFQALRPLPDPLRRGGWVPELVALAAEGTRAGATLCRGLPFLETVFPERPQAEAAGELDLARLLTALHPLLEEAEAALRRARVWRQQLPDDVIPGRWQSDLRRADAALSQAQATLALLRGLSPMMQDLAASEQPRNLLLLAQNGADRRATGGFITAIALLTLDRGSLTVDTRNSFNWINRLAPAPVSLPGALRTYRRSPWWTVADANWWPHFPSTAAAARRFLLLDWGSDIDGVIAVDDYLLQRLLVALGPVTVASYGETVDSANLMERIEFYVHGGGEQGPEAKRFLGELFGALLAKVQRPDPARLPALLGVLEEALSQRHLLLSFRDPALQDIVLRQGWGGVLQEAPQDYLMVVEANVGFSMVSQKVEGPALSLEVTIGQDRRVVRERLTLSYRNPLPEDPGHPCSWEWVANKAPPCLMNYVRVYLPKGTVVQSAGGFDDPVQQWQEMGREVLGGFFVLPAQGSKQLVLEYAPPAGVVDQARNQYRLLVQKQPGTVALPFALMVSLPGEGSPDFVRQVTDLRVDRAFAVALEGR